MVAKRRDEPRAHVGSDDVVVVEEEKERAAREPGAGVAGRGLEGVAVLPDVAEVRIGAERLVQDSPRVVGGMVVHDDALQVHVFARQNGHHAPLHHRRAVERGMTTERTGAESLTAAERTSSAPTRS